MVHTRTISTRAGRFCELRVWNVPKIETGSVRAGRQDVSRTIGNTSPIELMCARATSKVPASGRAALSFGSLKVIAALTDACLVLAASVSGFFIYRYYLTGISRFPDDSLNIGAIVAVLYVIVASSRGFYQINTMINPIRNVKYILLIIAITILLLIGFLFILKVGDKHSRGSIVVFAALALGFVTLGRLTLARISTIGVQNGVIAGRRAVAVGAASELDKILPYDLRRFGIEEVARVGLIQSEETMGLGEKGRAQIGDAINLARDLRATEFVLIIPWAQEVLLAEVGNLLRASPLSVKLLPDSTIRRILGRQSNGGRDPPLSVEIQREPLNGWERLMKRSLDLVLAVVAAILLAPVLLMTAVAIKIDSNGPVLFRQRRVGFDNREFLIYKFRTMTVMDDGEAVVQAQRGDWRVTRIGKLLRRSSIDELPQLLQRYTRRHVDRWPEASRGRASRSVRRAHRQLRASASREAGADGHGSNSRPAW